MIKNTAKVGELGNFQLGECVASTNRHNEDVLLCPESAGHIFQTVVAPVEKGCSCAQVDHTRRQEQDTRTTFTVGGCQERAKRDRLVGCMVVQLRTDQSEQRTLGETDFQQIMSNIWLEGKLLFYPSDPAFARHKIVLPL